MDAVQEGRSREQALSECEGALLTGQQPAPDPDPDPDPAPGAAPVGVLPTSGGPLDGGSVSSLFGLFLIVDAVLAAMAVMAFVVFRARRAGR